MAGRIDKEQLKIGSRYVSNFIPEHQGGLKKFYGSGHIDKVTDDLTAGYRMVPFDGCGEPLCLLFTPSNVYCVTCTDMYPVDVSIALNMMLGASYVQSSDVMYITNENMGQAVITYSGKDTETGHHVFHSDSQKFVTEPFFPLNSSSLGITSCRRSVEYSTTIGQCKIELHRVRNGNDEIVKEAYVGSEAEFTYAYGGMSGNPR